MQYLGSVISEFTYHNTKLSGCKAFHAFYNGVRS